MEPKRYTAEEIKKIAPGYRGKPENFNPDKAGKGRAPAQKQKRSIAAKLPAPTQTEATERPTPQKNTPLWEDAVFGIDTSCRELNVRETFRPSFSRLQSVVEETVSAITPDDTGINKSLTKEMCMYYATAHLWARLLSVKNKNQITALTPVELQFLQTMESSELNLPQPIYLMIKAIGNVKDKTGKIIFLDDHDLPTQMSQGQGGYHAAVINAESHNLFEEVPCLGVVGDTLMPIAGAQQQPVAPNIRVVPAGRVGNNNIAGYYGQSGQRKEEIAIALNSVGITANAFEETIPHTRLNIQLVQKVSDYFSSCPTFRMEKFNHAALSADGDSTQFIQMRPVAEENLDVNVRWTQKVARPYMANTETLATIGASYFVGFQLYKEPTNGDHQNWYCLNITPNAPADPAWIANRNERRRLPEGFGTQRFSGISDSLRNRTNAIVRRLIKTQR